MIPGVHNKLPLLLAIPLLSILQPRLINQAHSSVGMTQRADSIPALIMPAISPDGVPLAQIFETGIIDKAVYTQHPNKVSLVWGALRPDLPAGVLGSKYFPTFRNPDKERTIDWYKQNHPDWIIYKEDQTTPAYGFIYSYGGLTPLDISNPEVRDYYFNEFISPAIREGFRIVAMDNVDVGNPPKGAGHFVNGQWRQLYTGTKNDSAYQKNVIEYLGYLKNRLHASGVTLAANINFTAAPPAVIKKAVDVVDIWLDETGFTHRGKNILDSAWMIKFLFLEKVLPYKAYVTINQMNGTPQTTPADQMEWVLANFLLSRGPNSLLALASYDPASSYKGFFYRAEMDVNIGKPTARPVAAGNGVWLRKYEKGLVLVNPSSKNTVTVNLPAGQWKTMAGDIIEKQVTLAAGSGMVLK